jgi:hypothetical protein
MLVPYWTDCMITLRFWHTLNDSNNHQIDLQERIKNANKTYFTLQQLFKNKNKSKILKLKPKNTIIDKTLTYASETWIFTLGYSIPLRISKQNMRELQSSATIYFTIIQLSFDVILRHVSTHLPSHPQALLNLRLFTVKYYTIPHLRSHWLTVTVLIKLIKGISKVKIR